MHPKVINPYTTLAATHTHNLDKIITNLPPNPTFDDLNTQLTDSFFTPDPNNPSPLDLAVEVIRTVLPNAYNGYVNGGKTTVVSQQATVGEGINGYWRYNDA